MWRRMLFAGPLVLVLVCGSRAAEESPAELLEKGIFTEETVGNLDAAIEIYQKILADVKRDRRVAAEAQLHLGLCRLKQGDESQALRAFKRLIDEYPDQKRLLSLIRMRTASPVEEAFEQIERRYIGDVDRQELMEAAIRGMLRSLDQDSDFVGPDQLARLQEQVARPLSGIGTEVRLDGETRQLVVVSPIPGMPAYEAGIRAGDRIVEIDGQAVAGLSKGEELQTAVKLLRGKPGEAVRVGVKHAGSDELVQIEVVRAEIHIEALRGDQRSADGGWDFMLDDEHKIGYVRLMKFGPQTATELKGVLEDLASQEMRGLILDLRNNSGGSLNEAAQVADLFIESGTIFAIEGPKERKRVFSARQQGTLDAFPMAVLVNQFSASAAEVVAACLQDHRRAAIVGQRTFGKGSIQEVIALEGMRSALKLTTAGLHRPSGGSIQRVAGATESDPWGVVPDENCEVKLSDEELQQYIRFRMDRDVFREEGPPKKGFTDRQLEKAVEHILEQLKAKEPGPEASKGAAGTG